MATTQNTFTGDGSNLGPFSFTFKWLEPTDIKVTVAGTLKTVGTHYNLQSLNYATKTGGQVLFTAGNAPANGAAIVIYRQTDDSDLVSTFYSGSAIRAQDLNNNFTQNLYVTQESNNNATTATTVANTATTTANTALSNSTTAISAANSAVSTANTASSNASAAVSTANTANSNASTALSTANTANTNASAAVATANTASSNASTALSTANTASSNASTALSTANAALSTANAASATATTASTNATTAISTANTALSTANTANSNATAALNAVASTVQYQLVANVAAIPSTPANGDAVEVANSTGIESFTPLANIPVGFVGDSGLSVRMQYTSVGSTWNWLNYFAIDSETRYLRTGTGTVTSTNIVDGTIVNADINASAAIAGTKISPDFGSQNVATTGNVTINAQGDVRFGDADSSNWVAFQGPATISSNVTWTLPSADGTANQVLSTNGSGTLSWATAAAGGASVTTSDTAPSTPVDGDLWYDSVGGRLYVYYQDPNTSQWVDAAPQGGGSSTPTKIEVGNTKAEVTDTGSNGTFAVTTEGTQRLTVDSSGRTLIGTTSNRATNITGTTNNVVIESAGSWASLVLATNQNAGSAAYQTFLRSRGTTVGATTIVQNGDGLGYLSFEGTDGSNPIPAAWISAHVDGTPGANDMPGRIVLSTTPDGSASPVERMRITSDGDIFIAKTGFASGTAGIELQKAGAVYVTRDGGVCGLWNRLTNDGDIIVIQQASVTEGSISVSGTTVSYNGAHLSRWSQLPGGAVREEILRGTVLSNIDEMCGWGEEENEQLNRMKVSDVEGDTNVSGVFQAWDDDDDTYTDDFYCAMTGDFIVRIAEGVTVQRGDLLMSAGDGTAKPQDDDIIRSKTIAKVTSTHVTCTYDDGSYCVPCVLMAC